MSKFSKDWVERVAWTLAQAALGVLVVSVGDLDYGWAPLIAAGLAGVKGVVAKRVGDPESAATLREGR